VKILVIGGTGNISADCAAALHERGHEILVLTRGRDHVAPRYSSIKADRTDLAAMRAALHGCRPEVVLNFLGYDLPDVEIDYELFKENVRQYIFISSATVYAKPPLKLPLTEEAPLGNAWWDYGQKKLACETRLNEKWKVHRFPVTIVRPSHTYSRRWVPNPLSSSTYTYAARIEQGRPVFVPDGGDNPWTLTAAADFANGLVGLVGNSEAIGETFHITSDEVLTWNQITLEIASAMGAGSPEILKIPTDFICRKAPRFTGTLKGDKAHPAIFDNSKIKRFVPGFRARKSFAEGVRESIQWLRQHPAQQNLNPQLDATIDEVISGWRFTSAEPGTTNGPFR
jgi:nucleoside-diphosphate-sugar epimerase